MYKQENVEDNIQAFKPIVINQANSPEWTKYHIAGFFSRGIYFLNFAHEQQFVNT